MSDPTETTETEKADHDAADEHPVDAAYAVYIVAANAYVFADTYAKAAAARAASAAFAAYMAAKAKADAEAD